MFVYLSLILTWVLFLALFPLAFFWLRRAKRILVDKEYADVALKRGVAPANQEKWAPFAGLISLAAGAVCVWTIVGVITWIATGILIGPFQEYDTWSAIAGVTIWSKIIADFILRMQAHPFKFGKKNSSKAD